jgi:hypothetical protein
MISSPMEVFENTNRIVISSKIVFLKVFFIIYQSVNVI